MNTPNQGPVLHVLCGKIASGKSTLSATLGAAPMTVVLAEDAWLSGLFGDRMRTGADYVTFSNILQGVMAPHVVALLGAGVSVVLDFAANTRAQRGWMRQVAVDAGVPARLHFLDVPDAVCLERLRARNAAGDHPFAASEAQFHRFTANFVAPDAQEGFEIIRH